MSAPAKTSDLRTLYVVEAEAQGGAWFAMPGDAYLDREEAERVAKRSDLKTRVTVYAPVPS